MNIHRIYYPVLALGPGRRLGIWTRGCSRQCPGCMSPELWSTDPEREISLPALKGIVGEILAARDVDGITISGGEPLEQEAELMELLAYLRQSGVDDILLYTGFGRAELGEREAALTRYATVICGPYIKKENDGSPLRGSANQEILFGGTQMEQRYRDVLAGPRTVQPVQSERELFLIGLLDAPGRADREP